MAFKVEINAVDVTGYVMTRNPTPKISLRQNERSTATLTVKPGLLPAQFDPITIYDIDGVTAVFGGLVTLPRTRGIERGASTHFTDLQCVDYMIYADWCYWTKTYSAPVLLKTVLQNLITDKLGAYGVTLDAAQDNGDTLDAFSVDGKVSDFLRTLGTRCSPTRVVRMSPLKAIRMMVPGTDSAPVAITDANPNCLALEWTKSSFVPANYVTLKAGPTGEGTPTQQWTADGIVTSWEVDVPAVDGGWNQGYVLEGATSRTVSPPAGGGYYYFDATVGRGTISVGTGATPGAGVVLEFIYTALYPFTVIADAAVSPRIEYRAVDTAELLRAPAQATANGLLAKLNQSPREASILSLDSGWLPAQLLTATLTSRSIAAAEFTITQVNMEYTEYERADNRLWLSTITATETAEYQGSYIDQARAMMGGGSGGSSVSGGGGSVTALSGPVAMGGVDTASIPMGAVPAYALPWNWLPFVPKANMTVEVTAWCWARTGGVQVKAELAEDQGAGVYVQVNESGWVTALTRLTGETTFLASVEANKSYVVRFKSDVANQGAFGVAQLDGV